jgi:release factor glutamine methyltransferase
LKISEILAATTLQLREVKNKTPQLDSVLLISSVFSLSKEQVLLRGNEIEVDKNLLPKFLNLVSRRKKFEPISHLLGFREFFGKVFEVNRDVLDPRCDSETLVEAVLSSYDDFSKNFLEIGVGSGCLSISILLQRQNWQADAIEISQKALEVAKRNKNFYHLQNRLKLQLGDIFDESFTEKFPQKFSQKFSFLISNPPYIPTSTIPTLQPEVFLYEPRLALDGGDDGLNFYRRIADLAKELIKENGKVFLEIGDNQHEEVEKIFGKKDFKLIKSYKDLAQTIRVLCFL